MSGAPLVGRAEERRLLDALVDGAPREGAALVVRGPAGIGKTALLTLAAARAAHLGLDVTELRAVPAERHQPFAALHQLLRPLRGGFTSLADPHRQALDAAFGRTSDPAPDIFLISLATLELLGDAAAERPRLVVVEDAQWLDRPTADVLGFVARRLGVDRVVMLFSVRDTGDHGWLGQGLPELELGPLSVDESEELLARAPSAADLGPAARTEILRLAGGNPLALLELPSVTSTGLSAETGPLPVRLERAFTARLEHLDPLARALLLVAAADERATLGEVVAGAEEMLQTELPARAVAEADHSDLVDVVGQALRFRHPLMASAVYHAAPITERVAAHRALGRVFAGDADRSLWHRAAATLAPEPQLSAELESAAERARRRGANDVAVTALERAAALTTDARRRGRMLLLAAELAFELGRPHRAKPLLEQAALQPMTDAEHGRLALTRELVDPHPGEAAARSAELLASAEGTAPADIDLALDLLWLVASRSWWADPGRSARTRTLEVIDRVATDPDDPRVLCGLGYADADARGGAVVDRLRHARPAGHTDPRTAWMLGTAAVVTGAWDLARGHLHASIQMLREQGRLGQLPRLLVLNSMVAARMADWDVAEPEAAEARALGAETGQATWVGAADSVIALASAMRGEHAEALAAADRADEAVAELGTIFVRSSTSLARGLAASAAGDHEGAFDQLLRLFVAGDPSYHWTMRWWGLADLAHAAARTGRGDDVLPLVKELEGVAAGTTAVVVHLNLEAAQAHLADDRAAADLFERALGRDLDQWPYQRARLLLAHGELLRRTRRTVDARPPLREAVTVFDRIGARAWAERARQELSATGETMRAWSPRRADGLTPQELQIARLAAEGRTNREIAQMLFISHRTVGSHLYHVFPKLGITQRSQLAAALAARRDG
nr:LuxR family transcriptional regulator [Nocardioides thalensis]